MSWGTPPGWGTAGDPTISWVTLLDKEGLADGDREAMKALYEVYTPH